MELTITVALRILAEDDRMNFTIQEAQKRESGKHIGEIFWINRGHYSSMSGALEAAVQKRLVSNDMIPRVRTLISAFAIAQAKLARATEGFIAPIDAMKLEGRVFGNLQRSWVPK